jgi:hypothetical protein
MNYYEIKTKSTIAKELYDYAFNPQPWFPHYNFNVKPIPTELIAQDNFFKWLHARYGFVVGVLKQTLILVMIGIQIQDVA